MDGERLDLIIDRRLRSAMAVTPSADFTARVRERLALERLPRVWLRWPTLAIASGAIAAIVLAVALMRFPARDVRTVALSRPQIAPPKPAPIESVVGRTPTKVTKPDLPVVTNRGEPGPETQRRDVEVLVPTGQADAIRRFAEDLNDKVASRRWVQALADGTPNSGSYVLPTAPTIEHLPAAGSYDFERE